MVLPNPSISIVPVVGDPDFPALDSNNVSNLVGPAAANKQPNVLATRTVTDRDRINKLIENMNDISQGEAGTTERYLRRDGSLSMLADLSVGTKKVVNMAAGTAGTDAVNLSQLGTTLASYLLRNGTLAMTGALNMGTNKITALVAGTAGTDAVNVAQLGTLLGGYLLRNGTQPMTGALAMGTNKITGLVDGVAANDAVTVGQVPALAGTGSFAGFDILTTPGAGVWVVPAGVTQIEVQMWGGGGGSGRSFVFGAISGCGGSGGFARAVFTGLTPLANLNYFVGGGGGSGAAGAKTWFDNLGTSLQTILFANGGGFGAQSAAPSGGAGGTAGGTAANIEAITGQTGLNDFGGGSAPRGGRGGASQLLGAAGAGEAGKAPGGGSGGANGAFGNGGGGGQIIVFYYT